MSNLGDYLKALRTMKMVEKPVSLRSAADEAKVNYQTLSNYEEGNVERYDVNILKLLADYYGVTVNEMCDHI